MYFLCKLPVQAGSFVKHQILSVCKHIIFVNNAHSINIGLELSLYKLKDQFIVQVNEVTYEEWLMKRTEKERLQKARNGHWYLCPATFTWCTGAAA